MAIEKGRLIDILNQPTKGFTSTAGEPIPSSALTGKDMKHLSLQSDMRQKADEAWKALGNPISAQQHDAYRCTRTASMQLYAVCDRDGRVVKTVCIQYEAASAPL